MRESARSLSDSQIAEQLNREGRVSATGKSFSTAIIRWIRWRHQIPAVQLKSPKELTVKQVARQFGVSSHVVYYWIDRGVIEARQLRHNTPHWITLNAGKTRELNAWIKRSRKILKSKHS